MIQLSPFVSEKMWGYEKWVLSTHEAGKSRPPLPYDYPLLVKIIQADKTLSVQVHPDDAYAKAHENSRGKTECWYVLDANPGATLIAGLTGKYSPGELRAAITENRLEPFLRTIPVAPGDLVFIPAGVVHAIKGGIRVLEVQQSSDITYRLYDWGRGRECHVDKGLAVVKHIQPTVLRGFTGRFECGYFILDCSPPVPPDRDYAIVTLDDSTAVPKETVFFCAPGETPALPAGQRFMNILSLSREK
jgi:mannose-6-phosphate isomerase